MNKFIGNETSLLSVFVNNFQCIKLQILSLKMHTTENSLGYEDLRKSLEDYQLNEQYFKQKVDEINQGRQKVHAELTNLTKDYQKKVKEIQSKLQQAVKNNQTLQKQNDLLHSEIQSYQERLVEKEKFISKLIQQQNQRNSPPETHLHAGSSSIGKRGEEIRQAHQQQQGSDHQPISETRNMAATLPPQKKAHATKIQTLNSPTAQINVKEHGFEANQEFPKKDCNSDDYDSSSHPQRVQNIRSTKKGPHLPPTSKSKKSHLKNQSQVLQIPATAPDFLGPFDQQNADHENSEAGNFFESLGTQPQNEQDNHEFVNQFSQGPEKMARKQESEDNNNFPLQKQTRRPKPQADMSRNSGVKHRKQTDFDDDQAPQNFFASLSNDRFSRNDPVRPSEDVQPDDQSLNNSDSQDDMMRIQESSIDYTEKQSIYSSSIANMWETGNRQENPSSYIDVEEDRRPAPVPKKMNKKKVKRDNIKALDPNSFI